MAHDPWDSTPWYIDERDDTVNKEAPAAYMGLSSCRYHSKEGPLYLLIYRRAVQKGKI